MAGLIAEFTALGVGLVHCIPPVWWTMWSYHDSALVWGSSTERLGLFLSLVAGLIGCIALSIMDRERG